MARVPCIVRTEGHRGATALRRSHKPQAATSTPVTAGRRRAYLASCPFCREADGGSSRPGDRLRTVGGSLKLQSIDATHLRHRFEKDGTRRRSCRQGLSTRHQPKSLGDGAFRPPSSAKKRGRFAGGAVQRLQSEVPLDRRGACMATFPRISRARSLGTFRTCASVRREL